MCQVKVCEPHTLNPKPQIVAVKVRVGRHRSRARELGAFLMTLLYTLNPNPQTVVIEPPCSRVEGKSQVNLPQMPPIRSGICMGVDQRNHLFALGLPPEWTLNPKPSRSKWVSVGIEVEREKWELFSWSFCLTLHVHPNIPQIKA